MPELWVFEPTKTNGSLVSPEIIEYEGDTHKGRFRIRLNLKKKYMRVWVIEPIDDDSMIARYIAPSAVEAVNKLRIILDFLDYCQELREAQ